MVPRHPFGDRQPQPAVTLATAGGIQPLEGLERRLSLLRGNAGAVIPHLNLKAFGGPLRGASLPGRRW